jgi:molybdate transport system permease protein
MDSTPRADRRPAVFAEKCDRLTVAIAAILATSGILLFLLPVVGLAGRVPWRDLGTVIGDPLVLEALRLSLVTSMTTVLVALVVGTPLAWLLARGDLPGRRPRHRTKSDERSLLLRALRAALTLPMVLPPVVAGVGLLAAFGRRGLLGPLLESFGISLPFTTTAAVMAQTFVATPFLVMQVEAGLRALDYRYEEVASVFGASRFMIFRRVILPQLAPALGAGIAVTWARALGEFGATITFAGNLEGATQTMPLAVYLAMEQSPEAAYLLAFILLIVSFAILFVMRGPIISAAPLRRDLLSRGGRPGIPAAVRQTR